LGVPQRGQKTEFSDGLGTPPIVRRAEVTQPALLSLTVEKPFLVLSPTVLSPAPALSTIFLVPSLTSSKVAAALSLMPSDWAAAGAWGGGGAATPANEASQAPHLARAAGLAVPHDGHTFICIGGGGSCSNCGNLA
jgi:hypothetical protein